MSPRTNVWLLRFVPVRAETRLGSALRRTLDSYNEAAADHRTLVRFTVWTLAEVLVVVVVVFFAARALDVGLSFSFFAVVTPTILFLSRLPVTLDGLGVTETMYVVAFNSAGYAGEQGLAVALLIRAIRVAVNQIPGAIWLMLSRSGVRAASREGS